MTCLAPRMKPFTLTFSDAALDKIFRDARMIGDVRGHDVLPILTRYMACWSTDADGQRIDYGPGAILQFRPTEEPVDARYMSVMTSDGRAVFIDPQGFPSEGA